MRMRTTKVRIDVKLNGDKMKTLKFIVGCVIVVLVAFLVGACDPGPQMVYTPFCISYGGGRDVCSVGFAG